MDFVPATPTAEEQRRLRSRVIGLLAIAVSLAIPIPLLIVTAPYAGIHLPEFISLLVLVSPVAGLLVFLKATITPAQMQFDRLQVRAESLRIAVGKHYDLTLTSEEFTALGYPLERPASSFEVFGSFNRSKQLSGANFVEHTLYLVWADGKLQLSESEDGKNFRELQASELQSA